VAKKTAPKENGTEKRWRRKKRRRKKTAHWEEDRSAQGSQTLHALFVLMLASFEPKLRTQAGNWK
jgi:hypothetical protein